MMTTIVSRLYKEVHWTSIISTNQTLALTSKKGLHQAVHLPVSRAAPKDAPMQAGTRYLLTSVRGLSACRTSRIDPPLLLVPASVPAQKTRPSPGFS